MVRRFSRSILDGVDSLIAQWLGVAGKPRHGNEPLRSKQALIDLCEDNKHAKRPALSTAPDLIANIIDQIRGNYEAMGSPRPSESNWQWVKSFTIDFEYTSEEEVLEKVLVQVLGDDWVNQVSVCNAMAERKEYSRRIDLVHRIAGYEFEFIELKYGTEAQGYGSDTPLVAAMEVLQYALLYLFSREKRLYGLQKGKGNVLSAKGIHLVVLAPIGYYTYKAAGSLRKDYDLRWLEGCLNEGLYKYLHSRRGSFPTMDFRFQRLLPEFDQVYGPLKPAIDKFRKTGVSLRKGLYA